MSAITVPLVTSAKPLVRLTGDIAANVETLLSKNLPDTAYVLLSEGINRDSIKDGVLSDLCNKTIEQLTRKSSTKDSFIRANNLILQCCERKIRLDDSIVQRAVIALREEEPALSIKLLSRLLKQDYSFKRETIEVSVIRLRENFLQETADLLLNVIENTNKGISEQVNPATIDNTTHALIKKDPKAGLDFIHTLAKLGHEFKKGYIQKLIIMLDQAGGKKESCKLLEENLDQTFNLQTIEVAVKGIRDSDPVQAANILIKAFDKGFKPFKPVIEHTIVALRENNPDYAIALIKISLEASQEEYRFHPDMINITFERMMTDERAVENANNIIFFLDKDIPIDGGFVQEVFKSLVQNYSNELALKLISKSFEKGYKLT